MWSTLTQVWSGKSWQIFIFQKYLGMIYPANKTYKIMWHWVTRLIFDAIEVAPAAKESLLCLSNRFHLCDKTFLRIVLLSLVYLIKGKINPNRSFTVADPRGSLRTAPSDPISFIFMQLFWGWYPSAKSWIRHWFSSILISTTSSYY